MIKMRKITRYSIDKSEKNVYSVWKGGYIMLIRFNVSNFLSFENRPEGGSEEFSMIAGKVRNKKEHIYEDGKIKLLKFAAVYGANAAGKSNLVKAMDFMRRVILYGLPDGHTEKYCKTNPDNEKKPSYFEMEILLDGKYYAYGFEVILSQSEFISEWLVELHADNTEKILFTRDIVNSSYELGGELAEKGLKEKLDVYAGDVQNDGTALLLLIMNQNKKTLYENFKSAKILKNVFGWIRDSLDINYPNQPISDYSYLSHTDKLNEVYRIISAFGTGITGFEVREISFAEVFQGMSSDLKKKIMGRINKLIEVSHLKTTIMLLRTPSNLFIIEISEENGIECKTVEFCHGKKSISFNLEEESDGTVRMLDLIEILLSNEPKTYVVDELDRCLHPSLTYKFVKSFLQLAAKRNVQLIVTTHESRLMDFDLLRRDEIWFVNKRENGTSDIYSLEEYNTRFDQKVDKAYLDGRYGGVPIFNTVFPVC